MNSTCAGCPYLFTYVAHNLRYEYVPEEEDWFEAVVAKCSYLDEDHEISRIPYGEGESSKIAEAIGPTYTPPRPSWCKLHGREDSHFMRRFMQKD